MTCCMQRFQPQLEAIVPAHRVDRRNKVKLAAFALPSTLVSETSRVLRDRHADLGRAAPSQSDALPFASRLYSRYRPSAARRRRADEYDAAQKRGEVRSASDRHSNSPTETKASLSDLGLTGKEIHEARQLRDAEREDPGITRRTLDNLFSPVPV